MTVAVVAEENLSGSFMAVKYSFSLFFSLSYWFIPTQKDFFLIDGAFI